MQLSRPTYLVLFSLLAGAPLILVGCDSTGSNGGGEAENQAPTADATVSSSTADVGTEVTLDGSGSSDPDGDNLTFSWSLNAPTNSSVSLSNPSAEKPTFTPDVAGDYTASLEVSDGEASDTDDATVTAQLDVVEIGSDITSDRTLSADTDYLVTSSVCVESSSTLTIDPGVTVRFEADTGLKVCGDGSALVAEGTAENVITFTGTTDSKGFWKGIGFNSSNTNNVLKHAIIEDAGSEKLFASATIDGVAGLQLKSGSTLTLEKSTIQNNSNNGLHADEGVELRSFSRNLFTNNENASLHLHIDQFGALDGESDYGSSSVDIYGGRLVNRTITVSSINVPYRIFGERRIREGSDVTVEAGVTFEFASSAALLIEGDATVFKAQGTDSENVIFTGTSETKGFWDGIGIKSDNANNEMTHVTVEYAGKETIFAPQDDPGNIQILSGQLTLTESLIQESASFGLTSSNGASDVTESGNTYQANDSGARNF